MFVVEIGLLPMPIHRHHLRALVFQAKFTPTSGATVGRVTCTMVRRAVTIRPAAAVTMTRSGVPMVATAAAVAIALIVAPILWATKMSFRIK